MTALEGGGGRTDPRAPAGPEGMVRRRLSEESASRAFVFGEPAVALPCSPSAGRRCRWGEWGGAGVLCGLQALGERTGLLVLRPVMRGRRWDRCAAAAATCSSWAGRTFPVAGAPDSPWSSPPPLAPSARSLPRGTRWGLTSGVSRATGRERLWTRRLPRPTGARGSLRDAPCYDAGGFSLGHASGGHPRWQQGGPR